MKRKIALIAFSCLFVLSFGLFFSGMVIKAESRVNDRFSFDNVKYAVSSVAPLNDNFNEKRAGLVLYSYDSGSAVKVNDSYRGTFDIELKASSQTVKPDLSTYSLIFEDIVTGQKFTVSVSDSGTETNVYVSVNGEKVGICYNVNDAWDGKAHGYTRLLNEGGVYTRTKTTGTTSIRFNPEEMEISVLNEKNEYKTVWKLTERVMDGQILNNTLLPFGVYSVNIEFTAIKSGGKGVLTLYSINGENFGGNAFGEISPVLDVKIKENAVIGSKYDLPECVVYENGVKKENASVNYEIFDGNANKLAEGILGEGDFIPKEVGSYYVRYTFGKGETFFSFKAYSTDNVRIEFEKAEIPAETGANGIIVIPAKKVSGNLIEGSRAADVTISKDEKVIKTYKELSEDVEFKFEEVGDYSIVYSSSVCGNLYSSRIYNVSVSDDIGTIITEREIGDRLVGEQITIPSATLYFGGKEYPMTAKIIFPNGTESDLLKQELYEAGVYSIVYEYEENGTIFRETKTFKAEYGVDDLFSHDDKTSVVYDDVEGNAELKGALVNFGSSSGVVTYTRVVDLSEATKNDKLLELIVIPSSVGVHDMTGIYVTLTDRQNRDNFVTIRIVAGTGNAFNVSFIRAKASNQAAYTGLYKDNVWTNPPYKWTEQVENAMNHNAGGYLSRLNFGADNLSADYTEKTLVLYWDEAEKAVYSEGAYNLEHKEGDAERKVVDFDDSSLFSNIWSGFTDPSDVELSVSAFGVANTAKIKILSVNGYDICGEKVVDKNPPKISVDYEGNDSAPKAKVGMPYRIFKASASDDFCDGHSVKSRFEVYYGNDVIEVKDGCFIPDKEGFYEIRYSFTDGYGNRAEKTVEVEARSDVSDISASVIGEWQNNMKYGFAFAFPEIECFGGSGKLTVKREIIIGSEIRETDDEYIPLYIGSVTARITVTDYIGQVCSFEKTYEVIFEREIIFDEDKIVLPPAFIEGMEYSFPETTGVYYASANERLTTIKADIIVTDEAGERIIGAGEKYIPSGKNALIKYIFRDAEIEKTVEKNVEILQIYQDDDFLIKYFKTENAVAEANNNSVIFKNENIGKDAAIKFIRAVSARDFSVAFAAAEKNGRYLSGFEELNVVLTDSVNPDITVKFTFRKNGNKLGFSVNDEGEKYVLGSFTEKTAYNVTLSYDNDSFSIYGAGGSSLGKVSKTIKGETFNGFTSGEVYVSFSLTGVTDESAVSLLSIGNQPFSNIPVDTGDPVIYVDGEYSGRFISGSEIVLYPAKAYDIMHVTYYDLLARARYYGADNIRVKLGFIAEWFNTIKAKNTDNGGDYSNFFINHYGKDALQGADGNGRYGLHDEFKEAAMVYAVAPKVFLGLNAEHGNLILAPNITGMTSFGISNLQFAEHNYNCFVTATDSEQKIILSGINGTANSGLKVTVTVKLSSEQSVYLNGKILESSEYDVQNGYTTLNLDFVNFTLIIK